MHALSVGDVTNPFVFLVLFFSLNLLSLHSLVHACFDIVMLNDYEN